jgi:hypothetical protein
MSQITVNTLVAGSTKPVEIKYFRSEDEATRYAERRVEYIKAQSWSHVVTVHVNV